MSPLKSCRATASAHPSPSAVGRNAAGLWNATLFGIQTSDEIVSAGTSDGRALFTNAGRTQRRGLELSSEYELGEFSLIGAYTYLRATYDAGTNTGKRMLGLPQQQVFAQLAWKPRWAACSRSTHATWARSM